jgi:hypothetical protein
MTIFLGRYPEVFDPLRAAKAAGAFGVDVSYQRRSRRVGLCA